VVVVFDNLATGNYNDELDFADYAEDYMIVDVEVFVEWLFPVRKVHHLEMRSTRMNVVGNMNEFDLLAMIEMVEKMVVEVVALELEQDGPNEDVV